MCAFAGSRTSKISSIPEATVIWRTANSWQVCHIARTPISGAKEHAMNKAVLEITLKVSSANRPKAGEIYSKYKRPFLATIGGAESKELLIRDEDVQVIHGFDSRAYAESYLTSTLFADD